MGPDRNGTVARRDPIERAEPLAILRRHGTLLDRCALMPDWLTRRRLTDPVPGTLEVISATGVPVSVSATFSNYRLHGVLHIPGLPPTAVALRGMARVSKYPRSGQTLPVTADRAHPDRVVIEWDQIATGTQQGAALAAAIAEAEAGAQQTQPGAAGWPTWSTGYPAAVLPGYPAAAPPGASPYSPGGLPPGYSPVPVVVGAPGRPLPGAPGGGLTPEQADAWQAGGKVRATAVVVAASEVTLPPGMASQAPAGLFDVLLAVTRPDGATYNVSTRISFRTDARRAQVATVGARLPVLIDENDPSVVAVEVAALPT